MATPREPIPTPALPNSARAVLDTVARRSRHPGLQLDKFSAGGVQKDNQSKALEAVVQTRGDAKLLTELHGQRDRLLWSLGATRFEATTAGPLTLHLSRPAALENAGICLHPLYGFVYLPGSGLKGMARAWAETAEADAAKAARRGEVFGVGPGDKAGAEHAGAVVFHDAWPKRWPKLVQDVVNNHHREYYQGQEPPGDWQDPVPVTFLAIEPGETFDFALSPRPGADPELVELARDWLVAALTHRGAGAKTNAGYGSFRPPADMPVPEPDAQREVSESFTLTLTAPGFFAGARQDGSDCDLRPASLRGVLRWWWRTLHAGAMPRDKLKELEGQIWGDTSRAGMVRVTVAPHRASTKSREYDKKREARGLPQPKERKTIQGLWYASYGMDEKDKRRSYAEPGEQWRVELRARDTGLKELSPDDALIQAKAALWLLTRHGGVGSKARKGFGGFADIEIDDIPDLETCRRRAAETAPVARQPGSAESPDLTEAIERDLVAEWPLPKDMTWQRAIDAAGTALQELAKNLPNKQAREHLGVPRKPVKNTHNRHAAPYFMHLGRNPKGQPVFRFIGFPASRLPKTAPDPEANVAMLHALKARLDQAFGAGGTSGGGHGDGPGRGGSEGRASPKPRFPCPGKDLDGDEKVKVLGEDAETYKVEYDDGSIEFLKKDKVEIL